MCVCVLRQCFAAFVNPGCANPCLWRHGHQLCKPFASRHLPFLSRVSSARCSVDKPRLAPHSSCSCSSRVP